MSRGRIEFTIQSLYRKINFAGNTCRYIQRFASIWQILITARTHARVRSRAFTKRDNMFEANKIVHENTLWIGEYSVGFVHLSHAISPDNWVLFSTPHNGASFVLNSLDPLSTPRIKGNVFWGKISIRILPPPPKFPTNLIKITISELWTNLRVLALGSRMAANVSRNTISSG